MIWMLTHYCSAQSVVILRAATEADARRLAAEMMHHPAWVRAWMDPTRSECLPLDPDGLECHFVTKLGLVPHDDRKEYPDA